MRKLNFFDADRGSRLLAPVLATLFSLVLIPAWLEALADVDDGRRVLLVSLGVAYGLACVIAVPLSAGTSTSVRTVCCLVLLALGGGFVGLTGVSNSWVLLCALGITAVLMSAVVTTVITLVTVIGLSVVATWADTFPRQFPSLLVLVSVTAAVALMVRLFDTNAELRRARDRIAVFAVARERERFARDLHDILGHSLTTITVKTSLARRVLETGDVDRSIIEIGDVERLGRQALTDMRATVSEYREVTLVGELAAASETLRAAGVEADLPHAVEDVEPALRPVFGYVLREAVTNAVRHSGARLVGVRFGRNWITVTDDGVGAGAVTAGSGLNGLEERMRAFDGTLETGQERGGGFVVRASVPEAVLDDASVEDTASRRASGSGGGS